MKTALGLAGNWRGTAVRELILFAGDSFLVFLALFLGALVRLGEPINVFRVYTGATLLFAFSFLSSVYVLDLYNLKELATGERMLIRLCLACGLGTLVCGTAFYFSLHYRYGRGIFVLGALFMVLLAYAWRQVNQKYGRTILGPVSTLVVGTGRSADTIRGLLEKSDLHYKLVGFVTAGFETALVPSGHVLGDMASLGKLVTGYDVDCLVVACNFLKLKPGEAGTLTRVKFDGVRILDAAEFYMRVAEALPVELLDDSWLWFAEGFELLQAQLARRIKRLSDIVLAAGGLFLSLPLSLLTALAIKLDSPGPVFYRQKRVGWRENTFELVKFRSMRVGTELEGNPRWAALNDQGATRVGRVLRKLHIDEIPQMVNVLKGEMSFIGPRPERPEFVEQLKAAIPFYHLRHYVLPGITGWAQVNYPYGASLDDAKRKLQYDLYYIVYASLLLDLRILLRTIRVIMFPTGSR